MLATSQVASFEEKRINSSNQCAKNDSGSQAYVEFTVCFFCGGGSMQKACVCVYKRSPDHSMDHFNHTLQKILG